MSKSQTYQLAILVPTCTLYLVIIYIGLTMTYHTYSTRGRTASLQHMFYSRNVFVIITFIPLRLFYFILRRSPPVPNPRVEAEIRASEELELGFEQVHLDGRDMMAISCHSPVWYGIGKSSEGNACTLPGKSDHRHHLPIPEVCTPLTSPPPSSPGPHSCLSSLDIGSPMVPADKWPVQRPRIFVQEWKPDLGREDSLELRAQQMGSIPRESRADLGVRTPPLLEASNAASPYEHPMSASLSTRCQANCSRIHAGSVDPPSKDETVQQYRQLRPESDRNLGITDVYFEDIDLR